MVSQDLRPRKESNGTSLIANGHELSEICAIERYRAQSAPENAIGETNSSVCELGPKSRVSLEPGESEESNGTTPVRIGCVFAEISPSVRMMYIPDQEEIVPSLGRIRECTDDPGRRNGTQPEAGQVARAVEAAGERLYWCSKDGTAALYHMPRMAQWGCAMARRGCAKAQQKYKSSQEESPAKFKF